MSAATDGEGAQERFPLHQHAVCLPAASQSRSVKAFETRYDSGEGRSLFLEILPRGWVSFAVPTLYADGAFSKLAYHATIPQGRRYYRCSGGTAARRREVGGRDFSNRDLQMDRSGIAKTTIANQRRWPWETLLPLIAVDMLSVGYSFLVGCNLYFDSKE